MRTDDRLKEIDRYQSIGTADPVAASTYSYDDDSRLTRLDLQRAERRGRQHAAGLLLQVRR